MKKGKDLGSAHTGFHDWYWQRISAVLLLLLLPLFFGLLLAVYAGKVDFPTLNHWLTQPFAKIGYSILLLSLGLHLWMGLKVIVEDYIHHALQRALVLNTILLLLLVVGLYAMYHIWTEVSYSFSCLPCEHGTKNSGGS